MNMHKLHKKYARQFSKRRILFDNKAVKDEAFEYDRYG